MGRLAGIEGPLPHGGVSLHEFNRLVQRTRIRLAIIMQQGHIFSLTAWPQLSQGVCATFGGPATDDIRAGEKRAGFMGGVGDPPLPLALDGEGAAQAFQPRPAVAGGSANT